MKATRDCKDLFRRWDKASGVFKDDLRTASRQSSRQVREELGSEAHTYRDIENLKKRILEIRKIRKDHYHLMQVIQSTLKDDKIVRQSSLKQIEEAYEYLKKAITIHPYLF